MNNELFVLGDFDNKGEFIKFIRKGRNWNIPAYDNIPSAKRGLSQSKRTRYPNAKIIKLETVEVL